MKINVNQLPHCASLTFDGELTIYNAAEIKSQLLPYLIDKRNLEINLAQVSEIDSAGIQILLLIKREFSSVGKTLSLAAHSRAVMEAFELYNLAPYFGDPLLMSGESNSRASGDAK